MLTSRFILWAVATWLATAALALYLRRRGTRKRQVTVTVGQDIGPWWKKGDIMVIGSVHFEHGEISGEFVITEIVSRTELKVRPADRFDQLIWWFKIKNMSRRLRALVLSIRLSVVWLSTRTWDKLREIWRK